MDNMIQQNDGAYKTGFRLFDFQTTGKNALDQESVYSSLGWKSTLPIAGTVELLSPVVESPFDIQEIIPSWNALCGNHGWMEVFLRGEIGHRWTTWYRMAVWAPPKALIQKFSFIDQEDEDAAVSTDTLTLKRCCRRFQMMIRLNQVSGGAMPILNAAALTFSSPMPRAGSSLPGDILKRVCIEDVPVQSQFNYSKGGRSWCSPTCLCMILYYWRGYSQNSEEGLKEALEGTYDPIYGGNGNWSFNTAYVGSLGLRSTVRRFSRLDDLLPYLSQGIPLVMSVSWNREEDRPLDGSPIPSTAGHLIVITGFDGAGGAFVQDPAGRTDSQVKRTYRCDQLQQRWLEGSGGACYVIHPAELPGGG